MKKRTFKDSLTCTATGVLIGLIITAITSQLSMTYIFMFIALLILMIVGITVIVTDDFDVKLLRAYERGVRSVNADKHVCSCHKKTEG